MTDPPTGLTLDPVDPSPEHPNSLVEPEHFQRGFRRRFMLRFSLVVAILFGGWTAFLYVALAQDFGPGYGLGFLTLVHVRNTLFRYVLYSTIVQATVLALLTSAMVIFFSHRIAGPVFRVKRYLQAWRQGQRAPGGVKLRQGDQVQRFASALESSLGRLEQHSHATADKFDALASRLEAGETVAQDDIAQVLRELDHFKVS